VALPLLLAACESSPTDTDLPEGVQPITEGALLHHLEVLAADSMAGRRAGSQYERRSAAYVRDRFVEIGLEPGVSDYFQIFAISVRVDGQLGLLSQNVLGALAGRGDLAREWIVLGAHYDHIGVDPTTGIANNGADDNASGTAMMLEVARYLSEYFTAEGPSMADRRSIMFQAYGAEEVGLIGSFYYCQNPTVPMGDVMAMVNLDMVGRLQDNTLLVLGTSSSADWISVLGGVNRQALSFSSVEGFLNRSDQYCFYQRQRPVLFLHTGLHDEYHTPQDDAELINGPGMVRIAKLAADVLIDLALRAEPLEFAGGPLPLPASPGAISFSETRR
jgi:Zn-dependent M28 family amino/carboxypeptidase